MNAKGKIFALIPIDVALKRIYRGKKILKVFENTAWKRSRGTHLEITKVFLFFQAEIYELSDNGRWNRPTRWAIGSLKGTSGRDAPGFRLTCAAAVVFEQAIAIAGSECEAGTSITRVRWYELEVSVLPHWHAAIFLRVPPGVAFMTDFDFGWLLFDESWMKKRFDYHGFENFQVHHKSRHFFFCSWTVLLSKSISVSSFRDVYDWFLLRLIGFWWILKKIYSNWGMHFLNLHVLPYS